MIEQEDRLIGKLSVAGPGIKIPKYYGVESFNERDGKVLPESGDYTSGMVNAVDIENYISNLEIEALFN